MSTRSDRRDSPRRGPSSPRSPGRSPGRSPYRWSPGRGSPGRRSPRRYRSPYYPQTYGSSIGEGIVGGLVGGLVGTALGSAIGGGYSSYYYPSSYPSYYSTPVVAQPTYISSPTFTIPYSPVNNGLSLREKIGLLRHGQVLDVSHVDIYGRGSRIIPAITSVRSRKHGIPGIPIVSNNSRTYIWALEEIYGPGTVAAYDHELHQLFATYPNW